ncbi:MAG: carboxypeptidase regulatory-like domain-containing protein [Gemmatimonadaceae bacterium]
MMIPRWMLRVATPALPLFVAATLSAQGVTTSAINARVTDPNGVPRQGARVVAVHQPSGTTYQAQTRQDGRTTLPGMRVGGPYRVTASAIGTQPDVKEAIFISLGVATEIEFALKSVPVLLGEVTVTGQSETVFSSHRTGAATSVAREAIQTLPSISGRIEDFVRITPQYSGGASFGGVDNRMNNITIDGSYFNNSFGLAGQPGDRTNVAPISMDAIEQVQVNIAPYDVRQGNFIGAGVNTVTRSGTNEFRGSLYYAFRDNQRALHGDQARALKVSTGNFEFSKLGITLGGPIIKNKLFFFLSYEDDELLSPGTTFRANTGTQQVGGNITRVQESDLNTLSDYLRTNFGYETGPYQDYDHATPAARYLAKLDYNLNETNKLSVRYNQLDSFTDILLSNSFSLGSGNRRTSTDALNFQNSNYKMGEYIDSWAAEWNSIIGSRMANNLIIGYSAHDESRVYKTPCSSFSGGGSGPGCFPLVDVLFAPGGTTYTSFGFEPFTPNNELRYGSTQIQNNFSIYGRNHELTFGVSGEKYRSENVFFQGAQSVYVYNSLADFYTDADDYLANPTRTVSPVTLNKFEVGWANVPGQEKPLQPLDVVSLGAYAQDQWRINDKLRLTLGLRFDRPKFGDNGFVNAQVDAMNFRDENGATVKYSTSKLPDPKFLLSPRLGFNWDVSGDRSFQLRGGSGVFTGRPAYVWISNQIGNNGILTGFERLTNTTARPFHPDPDHYKPATVNGTPAASYALALTDEEFKFPQLWRTNLAADKKLPWWGLVGTGEILYNRDVNGLYYINANLPAPDGSFSGVDQRPRWFTDKCPAGGTQANQVNCNVSNAIVLKNANDGYSWNLSASLEKPFALGTFLKAGYAYGIAKTLVDPGSIASGSWTGNQISGDPNNPTLAYSATSPGHRFFAATSYRKNFFRFGATTAAVFWESRTGGNASYVFANDVNGDGGSLNDLIYVPKDKSEMNFATFTASGRTFTAAEQADAWEAFIQQDDYLSSHRGQYAERGAVFLPFLHRADLSFSQDVERAWMGNRNSLQVRLDFLNFTNLLNHNWGVGQRSVTLQPLTNGAVDAGGALAYRLRVINNQLITSSREQSAGLSDVYRIQMTVRYNFN